MARLEVVAGLGDVRTRKLEVGMLGTNCYIVMDDESGEGYVIDPGAESNKIIDAAGRAGLKCLGVLCTHGHMDHVGAAGRVAEALGVPVYISETDSGILSGTGRGLTARIGSMLVSKPEGVELLEVGQRLKFGGQELRVAATPGHTPGSVSFVVGEDMFCGDLVFAGSVGRTDLKGGSMVDLLESVRREVWTLPPGTRVHTGHGPSTTVAAEKATNPFLRDLEGGYGSGA